MRISYMKFPAFSFSIALVFSIALALALAPAAPPEALAQTSLAQSSPLPGAPAQSLPKLPKPPEGAWVPGRQITISQGCLMRWICDCSKTKAPRRMRIERTPSESTAGVCRAGPNPGAAPAMGAAPARSAGPGGACAICDAEAPKKKCMCAVKRR